MKWMVWSIYFSYYIYIYIIRCDYHWQSSFLLVSLFPHFLPKRGKSKGTHKICNNSQNYTMTKDQQHHCQIDHNSVCLMAVVLNELHIITDLIRFFAVQMLYSSVAFFFESAIWINVFLVLSLFGHPLLNLA